MLFAMTNYSETPCIKIHPQRKLKNPLGLLLKLVEG